ESLFSTLQVYERLEKLQAVVAGVPRHSEAASCIPPSPQENSYVSSTGGAHSGAAPWQPLAAPSGASVQAVEQLQRGLNQPVESDESLGGLSAALRSWHLTPSCPLGPAPLGEASCPQGDTAGESSWGSGPGFRPTAVEGLGLEQDRQGPEESDEFQS
uniref:Uncharacterized protein n=1 Tax=Piliocolobus tephrosceles TaxID=591936 RepID=A0A8C9GF34_9PRIM